MPATVFSNIHIKYTHSWFLLNTHSHTNTFKSYTLGGEGVYFYKTLCFVLRNDDQKRVVNDFEVIPISMDFYQTIPFGIKLRISLKLEIILYKFWFWILIRVLFLDISAGNSRIFRCEEKLPSLFCFLFFLILYKYVWCVPTHYRIMFFRCIRMCASVCVNIFYFLQNFTTSQMQTLTHTQISTYLHNHTPKTNTWFFSNIFHWFFCFLLFFAFRFFFVN